MKNSPSLVLGIAASALLSSLSFVARPAAQSAPPPAASAENDAAASLYQQTCGECHDSVRIVSKRRTKAEWQDVINKMIEEGATGSGKDFENIFGYLLRHYGTEAAGIYNLGAGERRLLRRLVPPHPAVEAEVVHAVRREMAQTVEDVMVRRTHLFYETADRGVSAARRVAELMARERGWDEARVDEEAARYVAFAGG